MNRLHSTALIIGAGIAGPVAALVLQRAGIEAEIYEARDTDEDYASSWLILADPGMQWACRDQDAGARRPRLSRRVSDPPHGPVEWERQAFWSGAQWRPLRGGSLKPCCQARHLEPHTAGGSPAQGDKNCLWQEAERPGDDRRTMGECYLCRWHHRRWLCPDRLRWHSFTHPPAHQPRCSLPAVHWPDEHRRVYT